MSQVNKNSIEFKEIFNEVNPNFNLNLDFESQGLTNYRPPTLPDTVLVVQNHYILIGIIKILKEIRNLNLGVAPGTTDNLEQSIEDLTNKIKSIRISQPGESSSPAKRNIGSFTKETIQEESIWFPRK